MSRIIIVDIRIIIELPTPTYRSIPNLKTCHCSNFANREPRTFGNIARGTTMKKKNILLIVLGILLLVSAIHFITGTTITINGKQVTSIGGYIATYLALVIIAVVLVILIPSVFILTVVLSIIFVLFIMLFFPLMPIASLLLPAIILAGIVYLVYRLVKKKKVLG
jgi:hypothetical protein